MKRILTTGWLLSVLSGLAWMAAGGPGCAEDGADVIDAGGGNVIENTFPIDQGVPADNVFPEPDGAVDGATDAGDDDASSR